MHNLYSSKDLIALKMQLCWIIAPSLLLGTFISLS